MTIFWSPTGRAFEHGKPISPTDPRIASDPRSKAWAEHLAAAAGKRPGVPVTRDTEDEFGDMTDDDPTAGMEIDDFDELPDTPLGDLIPDSTRRGTKRTREEAGLPIDMDGDPEAPTESAMVARGSGPGNTVSKETPVSPYPSLSYGLQETHTTILPWVGWLTAGGCDKNTPNQLKIRMNSPWDMIDVTTTTIGSTDGGRLTTKGIYNSPLDTDSRISTSGTNTKMAKPRTILIHICSRLFVSNTVRQRGRGHGRTTSMARLLERIVRILHRTRM